MAAAHERWVIELFSALNSAERSRVYRQLAKLKLHVAGAAAASD
jgi:DNA-binding transcriptional ArsR family regulator